MIASDASALSAVSSPAASADAGHQGVPVSEAARSGRHFALARSYGHARGRNVVPIAASELVNVAQDLPLLFRKDPSPTGDRWTVVGVTAADALKRPAIDTRGGWRGEYAPVVLRLHPFIVGEGAGPLCIDPQGLRDAPEGYAFTDPNGLPSDRLRRVVASVEAAREGIRRLGERVAALDAAGLVVPAPLLIRFDGANPALAALFAIDGRRLGTMAPADVARLIDATPSALDLAVAAMYSVRRLAGDIVVPASGEDEIAARIAAGLTQGEVLPARDAPVPTSAGAPLGYSIDASISLDFSGLSF